MNILPHVLIYNTGNCYVLISLCLLLLLVLDQVAASPVPHLFLPRFRSCRARLLRWFRQSLDLGDFKGTPVGELMEG